MELIPGSLCIAVVSTQASSEGHTFLKLMFTDAFGIADASDVASTYGGLNRRSSYFGGELLFFYGS